MANHIRRQIRDAAVTALTGLTTSGSRVYDSRTRALQADELPGLRVYLRDEPEIRTAAIGAGAARVRLERSAELVIECCQKKNDAAENDIDLMLKEVEIALSAVQSLGGAKRAHPRRIEVEMDGEAEEEIMVGRIVYEVLYYTALNAPDVAL